MSELGGYKNTEFGLIPDSWEIKKFKDLVEYSKLGTNDTSNSEEGLPLVKMGNLTFGGFNFKKVEYINAPEKDYNEFLLKKGDFLFNTRNTPQLVGKCAVWNKQLKNAIYNNNIMKVVFDKETIPDYISYQFNNGVLQKKIRGLATGTTSVAAIYWKDLSVVKVPLPSVREQQKIVTILTSVEKTIEKTEAIIEQTEKVKKGLMQQLLTKGIGHMKFKKTDMGEIPEKWEVITLNDVVLSLDAGVSVNSENRNKETNEKGILKTSAVTNRVFNPNEHKTILPNEIDRAKTTPKKGHIIISRMNTKELVGASSYVESDYDDLFLPDRLWQANLDNSKVSSVWLSFVLTSSEMRNRISEIATGTSGSMKNISKQAFLNLKIALPTKNEQEKIADILDSIDQKQLAEKAKILKLLNLKKSLMQSLLTGKIRVKVDEAEVTKV
ncbi:restriction endonuclease subunit S [Bacillus wiedmannii]|uniref:Restriction endonuclease subunit S n=1 Tax=Bacillus wiedmannii TaxID=1890302 RepID=A0A2A7VXE6_9BACI|nr:restriction endonuclease subunit S [Bacillus wiedmannii]PEJ06809.1 restriction endonuclease subunit S [Bacillus wiedmannii]PHC68319.1 restriction endonuclease subunit S [Bacillus wiedmannii]